MFALQYRILLQGCWYELFGGDPDDCPTEMDNRREQELSQPLLGEESLIVRHSSSYQSLGSDESPAHTPAHLPLFLPGRILHITEDGPTRRWVCKCFMFPMSRFTADFPSVDDFVYLVILFQERQKFLTHSWLITDWFAVQKYFISLSTVKQLGNPMAILLA